MGDSSTIIGANMEWFQLYEQSFLQEQGSPSNSSTTNTTTSPPSSTIVSPSGNQGSTNNSFSKPIITRRRSRASKKTPTTHLNANATNFRALVQKFTGCPKKSPNGPINLNFKLGRVQSRRASSNLISLFGGDNNNTTTNNNYQDHHHHHHQQEQPNPQPVEWPEQSIGLEEAYCRTSTSFHDDHDREVINNNVDHENNCNNLEVPINSVVNYGGSSCNYLEMPPDDGFFDFSNLHEFRLLEESFSCEDENEYCCA